MYSNSFFHCSLSLLTRKWLFDGPQTDPTYQPEPEDRPGGFNWGVGVAAGDRESPPPAEDGEPPPPQQQQD